MTRRMNRTLASLKWSLLGVLAIAVLGLLAGEPVDRRSGHAAAVDNAIVVVVAGQ